MANEKVTLKAEPRSEIGKGAARALRREGYIPGVIYGHGEETTACKVDRNELEKLITSIAYESRLIDLKTDGGSKPVLIREVQFHPFRPQILHIDFLAVHKGEKIRLDIPIRVLGTAVGVKEGGILEHLRHEVEVRCDPDSIPEALEIDITELEVGDSLTIGDLRLPEGVDLLDDPATTILSVVPPTIVKEPEPEEEELAALEALEEGEREEVEEGVEGEAAPSEGEGEAAEEER